MTRKPENGRHRSSSSSSAAEMDVIVHAKGDFMEVYGLNHGLIYLLKDPRDPLLHIHLFESEAVEEVGNNNNQCDTTITKLTCPKALSSPLYDYERSSGAERKRDIESQNNICLSYRLYILFSIVAFLKFTTSATIGSRIEREIERRITI